VNGTMHELSLDVRLTLLDTLRDVLGLTGTKKGCDQTRRSRGRLAGSSRCYR
jgi:aerobic-type carbon monoxide dehydrogenase small subunit (CoxS/CutS family)